MKQNALLSFFFLFSLQTSCMIISHKHTPKLAIKKQSEQKERKLLDLSQIDPFEDLITCEELYSRYVENKDLLNHYYLHSNDYTAAMVSFARKNDVKKIELLMQHEGIDNKNNRKNILMHFGANHGTELQNVIEIYKKKYDKENIYNIVSTWELVINHVPVIQLLLEQGYDPNIKRGNDNSPILFYATEYNINALKLLLAHPQVDINAKNNNGLTALHCAARDNNINALKLLLAYPQIDINAQDKHGFTALYWAAVYKTNALKLLLADNRVDTNLKNNSGYTVFQYLVANFITKNNIDALKILLADDRVDAKIKDICCVIAYDLANNSDVRDMLLSYNSMISYLQLIPFDVIGDVIGNLDYKANMQFIRTCKRLYGHYAEKNDLLTHYCLNSNDYTGAMVCLARKNDAKKIELLIQYEGEINKNNRENILKYFKINPTFDLQQVIEIYKETYDTKNTYQIVAFDEFVKNNTSVLQLLLKQGFDPNVKNDDGDPIILYAAKYNTNALEFLLARQVDINAKNNNGMTALHCAAMYNFDALKILLAKEKINLNAKNIKGNTAFLSAVKENNINCLKLLLTIRDVDQNARDKDGGTALHHVIKYDNNNLLKILLETSHVDPNIKDFSGYTVLDYAIGKNKTHALKLLRAKQA
jgi:ankyrin repeat protein